MGWTWGAGRLFLSRGWVSVSGCFSLYNRFFLFLWRRRKKKTHPKQLCSGSWEGWVGKETSWGLSQQEGTVLSEPRLKSPRPSSPDALAPGNVQRSKWKAAEGETGQAVCSSPSQVSPRCIYIPCTLTCLFLSAWHGSYIFKNLNNFLQEKLKAPPLAFRVKFLLCRWAYLQPWMLSSRKGWVFLCHRHLVRQSWAYS